MRVKVLALFAGLAVSSFGASISSGVAPWLVNGNPASVISPLAGGWVGNVADGQWMGTTSNDGTGAPAGSYTFSLNIGALIGAAGTLSLQYASDNAVAFSITNGSLSGATQCGAGDPQAVCSTATLSLSGVFAANSTLTATVLNGNTPGVGSSSPMGLLVAGTADVGAPVPEPSTYAMMVLGGAATLLARVRRRG